MPAVTVRNLPLETHRVLKVRAALNGRSTEAEIRMILQEAVKPELPLKIGSELALADVMAASSLTMNAILDRQNRQNSNEPLARWAMPVGVRGIQP